MTNTKVIIKNVVSGTLTNADAVPLRHALENALSSGHSVLLSLEGVTTISSSFLNSSIGEIVDHYGFNTLTNRLKIINYTPEIANALKKYMEALRNETA